MGNGGKCCLLLKYCMLCFGEQPCTNPSFTTIAAGHSGTEKPKEKRCKQNPSGELVSMFQALVLLSSCWAARSPWGCPGPGQSAQPGLQPWTWPLPLSSSCLVFCGYCQCCEGFQSLEVHICKCQYTTWGPDSSLESSSLRLYLFSPVKPCTANKGRAEISSFLSDSSFLKPRKLHCKTCWLLLSSFAGGEMNL